MLHIAFEDIVKELSERNNTPLNTEGASSCIVKTEDNVEIVLEMSPEGSSIAVISSIGMTTDDQNGLEMLIEMLNQNNFPHDSGVFAFDTNRHLLILNHLYKIQNFSMDDFLAFIDRFSKKVAKWDEILKTGSM